MYVNSASAPIWLFVVVVFFFTKNQAHTHTLTHTRARTHTHTQRRFHVCVYYVHTRIMYVIFVAPHSHKLIITIRLLLLLSFLLLRSSSSSFLIIFALLLYFIFICVVSSLHVHMYIRCTFTLAHTQFVVNAPCNCAPLSLRCFF